ncbi:23S rRNA (pseudouridine(1915)-N(3))-methyltransferase RlmH [Bauldia litoralis]|nr:23S rRNA (pseudouridine(1915)-N(3))-methyltransferase RlmH [Bauldia litoralis]
MKITMVAVGRLKAGPEREMLDRYLDRADKAGRQIGLSFDLRELAESAARQPAARKAGEAESIAAAIPPGAVVVVLDERGKPVTSRALADRIAEWRDSGRDMAFVIGGPDGLAPDTIARADLRLAFGAMTWPHQLVRIMLAEQLYRTVTILAGHPYHRD